MLVYLALAEFLCYSDKEETCEGPHSMHCPLLPVWSVSQASLVMEQPSGKTGGQREGIEALNSFKIPPAFVHSNTPYHKQQIKHYRWPLLLAKAVCGTDESQQCLLHSRT